MEAGSEARESATVPQGTLMVSTSATVRIVDLTAADPERIAQAANLLQQSFHSRSSAWPDIASARQEVMLAMEPSKIWGAAMDSSPHDWRNFNPVANIQRHSTGAWVSRLSEFFPTLTVAANATYSLPKGLDNGFDGES
jgi:hypothetical protein